MSAGVSLFLAKATWTAGSAIPIHSPGAGVGASKCSPVWRSIRKLRSSSSSSTEALPAASEATALTVITCACVKALVLNDAVKPSEPSASWPNSMLLMKNLTFATPALSAAVAETWMTPLSLLFSTGPLRVTVGGATSRYAAPTTWSTSLAPSLGMERRQSPAAVRELQFDQPVNSHPGAGVCLNVVVSVCGGQFSPPLGQTSKSVISSSQSVPQSMTWMAGPGLPFMGLRKGDRSRDRPARGGELLDGQRARGVRSRDHEQHRGDRRQCAPQQPREKDLARIITGG